MMSDPREPITVTHEGPIAIVTLNRPHRRNALDTSLVEALLTWFQARRRDADCRVIVLAAAGDHFCVGADLFAAAEGDELFAAVKEHGDWAIGDVVRAMRDCPQPIIALANGAVAGAGLAFALAADVIVAADTATFSTAFIRIGLSGAELGVSWRLQRTLGLSLARELIYTGDPLVADKALAAGLVSRVVAAQALRTEGMALATRMSAAAPDALRLTKRTLDAALQTPALETILELEERAQMRCLSSPGFQEAVDRFNAARAARRQGV
jgi:enoyl-CoA hydratase/carnithine racemase